MLHALKEPKSDHREKPDGGYVHVPTFRFAVAFWAYLEAILSIRAVRVLLALHELGIRRAAFLWSEKKAGRKPNPDFTPHFSTEELGHFCGLPNKKARVALNELLKLGLVTEFSAERFQFADSVEDLDLSNDQCSEFREWFSRLTSRRRVPFPRRILALACESSSSAQIALILGASLRCIYLHPRKGGFTYSGWLSIEWLSQHFGISPRALKGAKAHLVQLGWLQPTGRVGRYGQLLEVNPAWERLDRTAEGEGQTFERPKSAPQNPPESPKSAPPETRESFSETEIQIPRESPAETARNFGPGIFNSQSQKADPEGAGATLPPPRLSSIDPNLDFKDLGRALELFRQAVKCGVAPNDSEYQQLVWVAAIERARTVQAGNPAGLFLFLVKNKKISYLSEGHFDAANRRLKIHRQGDRPSPLPLPVPGGASLSEPTRKMIPALSRDAQVIKAVRGAFSQKGIRVTDLLPHLRRADPTWNRTRLDAAVAELDRPWGMAAPVQATNGATRAAF